MTYVVAAVTLPPPPTSRISDHDNGSLISQRNFYDGVWKSIKLHSQPYQRYIAIED